MGKEIERKFLLKDDSWKKLPGGGEGVPCFQAYFALEDPAKGCVRLRILGEKAFLTIKGPTSGFSRDEFEFEIPLKDAEEMRSLPSLGSRLEKKRYYVRYGGFLWEIDEFLGENAPLVLAEVELSGEETVIELPPFIGEEVSSDKRYFNGFLSRNPYSLWEEKK